VNAKKPFIFVLSNYICRKNLILLSPKNLNLKVHLSNLPKQNPNLEETPNLEKAPNLEADQEVDLNQEANQEADQEVEVEVRRSQK
jgi:hypothetical protein